MASQSGLDRRPTTSAVDTGERPLSPRVVYLMVWLCIASVVVRPVIDVSLNGRPSGVGADVAVPQTLVGHLVATGLSGSALALAGLAIAPRLPRLRPPPVAVAMGLLLGLEWLVSRLRPDAPPVSLSLAVLCMAAVGVCLVAPMAVPRARPELLVAYPLGIVGALSLAWLAVQPTMATFEVARWGISPLDLRLAGVTEHPNILGLLMGIALTLAVTHRFRLRWSVVLVSLTCLVLSESRTAMAAAFLSIVLVAFAKSSTARSGRSAVTVWAAMLASLLACLAPLWLPSSRATAVVLSERPRIWQVVLDHWTDEWLVGHGPTTLQRLALTDSSFPALGGHAHNLLLQELFVAGVVGLAVLLALLVAAARGAIASARAGRSEGLAVLVFVLVSAPTEDPVSVLQHGSSILAMLFLVLLCTHPRRSGQPAEA